MAVSKFSQITASATDFSSGTDLIMGVRSGTTDLTWTLTQLINGIVTAGGISIIVGTTTITSGTTTRLLYDLSGIVQEAAGVTIDPTSNGLVLSAAATGAASLLTLTGQTGVLAASQPLINATQTWNAAGVSFTGVKFNFTDTASASGSKFLDIQSSSVTVFGVLKNTAASGTGIRIQAETPNSQAVEITPRDGTTGSCSIKGGGTYYFDGSLVSVPSGGGAGNGLISGGASFGSIDIILGRAGAATFQLGGNDVASPVAQTIQVQSVVAGTAATAGVDFTIQGSRPTGASVGGSIIFKVAGGTGSGTAQTAASQQFAITGNGNIVLGNAAIATNATDGFLYCDSGAGTPTGTPTTFTGRVPLYIDTTNSQLWLFLGGAWKQPKTPAGAATVTWQ